MNVGDKVYITIGRHGQQDTGYIEVVEVGDTTVKIRKEKSLDIVRTVDRAKAEYLFRHKHLTIKGF